MAAVAAFALFLARLIWRHTPLAIMALPMILMGLPASAQEAAATGFIEAILPQLRDLLGVVLMLFLTWAGARFTKRTDIEIEAWHRDALHSALMTGAQLAAARQLTGKAATGLILEYVRHSVPDALAKLSPDAGVLADLAEAKLMQTLHGRLREALNASRGAAVR